MAGVIGVASISGDVLEAFTRKLSEESANGSLVIHDSSNVGIILAVPRGGSRWVPSMVQNDHGSFCVIDGDTSRIGDPSIAAESLLAASEGGRSVNSALGQIDEPVMISLFDASTGVLTVSRDPMGLGPVFFAVEGESLWWSSSLSSLRRVAPRSDIDRDAIDFFISSGFTPSPWTFSRTHRKLGAEELIRWSNGESQTLRYAVDESFTASNGETLESLYERRLPDAVGSVIQDPERTGVLLSSGVDSAVVLAVAARQTGVAPPSFTFDYGIASAVHNEAIQARRVADHVGSEHFTIEVDAKDIPARLDPLLDEFGDPFSYGLHSVMLAGVRDTGVHDLLSGAVTEPLDGQQYNALRYLRLSSMARGGVVSVDRLGEAIIRSWSPRFAGRPMPLEGKLRALSRGVWSARTLMDENSGEHLLPPELRALLYPDHQTLDGHRAAREALQASDLAMLGHLSTWQKMAVLHYRYFTAEHLQSWNFHAGRAHDLTIRSPFGRGELWRGTLMCGFEPKDKPSLRRYAASLLPDDIAYAPKLPQSVPINQWLRGPLKPWLYEVLDARSVDSAGLFESKGVDKLVQSHMTGRADLGWALWNLTVTHTWLRKFNATG